MMDSGKLVEGGQFADSRGHFFLIDVENEKEMLQLLNRGLLDSCYIESHPVVSFKIFSTSLKRIQFVECDKQKIEEFRINL